jgi:CRISPR-associated protein Cmr4
MTINLSYLYLLSPLHTGGATQEGNLLGIARESHTDLPYIPSSTLRGRLRASTPTSARNTLWGNTIEDVQDSAKSEDIGLTQGQLWVGDVSILWFPVPSLSHGVVWISSPLLLKRWARIANKEIPIPKIGSFSDGQKKPLYLKDAIFKADDLSDWVNWKEYLPKEKSEADTISKALILSDRNCQILVQSSLWRQVRVKLNEQKNVDGGFRYEESIPPETLMFYSWGVTTASKESAKEEFMKLVQGWDILQIGGQESLGRGFVAHWLGEQN